MKQQFYTHLISLESIHMAFDDLELHPEHREELLIILESHIHHVVLDLILSKLPEEERKQFMAHLATENHDELWNVINAHIDAAEAHIVLAVEAVKAELHADIAASAQENRLAEDTDDSNVPLD